jgi:hypothetical protein
MSALRHPRKGKSIPTNNASQRTISGSTTTDSLLSQRSGVNTSHSTSEKHRGRRRRATVQLRIPPRGRKVGLEPHGDRYKHSLYVNLVNLRKLFVFLFRTFLNLVNLQYVLHVGNLST